METVKIEIIRKTLTTNDKTRTFYVYKGVQKNGKLIDVKFTRDVTNIPKIDNFIIEVSKDKINLDKDRKYPCYWVKEILPVMQQSKIEDLENVKNVDLPF